MWWFGISVFLFVVVIFLLVTLERLLKLQPHTGISDLWFGSHLDEESHLTALSLDKLHEEVLSRRRDNGFDIHPGNSAAIHWYKGKKEKTKVAVVFIHGWSASPQEIFAVCKAMADNLKANLYCARLSGHGGKTEYVEDGGQHFLREALPDRLFADAFDAAHIGEKLGDKIVLVGSSTGGALCTYVATHAQSELKSKIAALVGVSPAYAMRIPGYFTLGLLFSWFRAFLPEPIGKACSKVLVSILAGKHRNIAPRNDEHHLRTTLCYPSEALLSVFAVIWEAHHLDFSQIEIPTMFIGCSKDDTINWDYTCGPQVFGKLKGPKLLLSVKPTDTDHPHVLGSHFLSPSYVDEIQKAMTAFVGHHVFPDDEPDDEQDDVSKKVN